MKKNSKSADTDRVLWYFRENRGLFVLVTVTGLVYNVGMVAGPLYEGKLAQCLFDILGGKKTMSAMLSLALQYVLVILVVQGTRFLKRLYVRKFGNRINKSMKEIIYRSLLKKSRRELYEAGTGTIMTKALSDADACAEGMRKFTTEIFDTGVVMIAYLVMLLIYDWRLTIISMIFPPIAYIAAELLKKKVTETTARSKESTGHLNASSLERVQNALTYRVYGQEEQRNQRYESVLTEYEKNAVRANVWETSLQPVYQIIAMAGAAMIIWFGAKNVLGTGWTVWNIGMFSTFLSCFTKLATKASKSAKLFNAVQKAEVSWKRIKPYLKPEDADEKTVKSLPGASLAVNDLTFSWPDQPALLKNISFSGKCGEVIGITGPVACGKSTLGQVFLNEYPHEGEIAGLENFHVNYLGHAPELFSGSVEDNIRLGKEGDITGVLKAVSMDREVSEFPDREKTLIGDGGVRLSGGQQARIALTRTLYHKESPSLLILDDPFSAVDLKTEQEIFGALKLLCKDDLVIIISHRLSLFPAFDKVLFMKDGSLREGTHEEFMETEPEYRKLYELQTDREAQHE